jgi:hypothetical protein
VHGIIVAIKCVDPGGPYFILGRNVLATGVVYFKFVLIMLLLMLLQLILLLLI